ncbi:MAG: 3-dehydroquinate synthase [Bacteroidales bacterium]|nr:3-dehydroquinate synthase [Bacteroidales bacterium]
MICNKLSTFIKEKDFLKIVIFTDRNVLSLYPHQFDFIDENRKVMITLPNAEAAKSLSVYGDVCRQLLAEQVGRDALFINWGGGAVSDFGGFVASTFKRGVSMVNVPTTLLAMIDAAVGGKNALNVGGVKNAVGTFYLPEMVLSDTQFLTTLPQSEILNGMGELLKYALIGKASLWEELKNLDKVSAEVIKPSWITFCREYKERVVERDFRDNGERRLLNFGHTAGHALEAAFAPTLSHGHAVALGCVVAAYISYNHNFITKETFDEIHDFVKKWYSFVNVSDKIDEIIDYCRQDKKNSDGQIHFILLNSVGNAFEMLVAEEELRMALQKCFI